MIQEEAVDRCTYPWCPYPNQFTNFTDNFFDESLRDAGAITAILRLTIAQCIGIALGWVSIRKNEKTSPGKIITYSVVCTSACLFGMLSSMDWLGDEAWKNETRSLNADVGRVAAAVVQGVGFLGAGFIAKGDHWLHGMQDAAFLWAAAALGLAVGYQYYILAVYTVLLFKITIMCSECLTSTAEPLLVST